MHKSQIKYKNRKIYTKNNIRRILTTTITKGTREKLLPNLEDTSTENSFLLRKQQISTTIPVNH
jgi:hypothetical protein